ncbi:uncharacterized protein RHOBADRAFT_47270 [Rhodotorula graminis WP1]|uniref:Uncharacterized protein n=1 Tax=Rhodotorula graminis (strain WP1) TaxID=578459 RepID=A0A0P9GGS8_RHOGW|nr:uncharacterized protein RHOBADRAFT_47270 [Rhodotorula graminis WP1]KPV72087.1 hypothetical protein RHOBADRAFT_47270 [Rhodotorula graminis WP1]
MADRPSPLLRLSPELLDHIVLLSLPPKPRPARLALSSLLRVCRTLAPVVRRHLYLKLSLVVAAPSGQDLKLVALLRAGVAGHLVRILKVRAPDPDPSSTLFDDPDVDPVTALVPQPRLAQPETLDRVAEALELMPRVRHVELDLRVGAWLEGDVAPEGDFGEPAAVRDAQLARLERALSAWGATLETVIVAVEDVQQRLQVWADPVLGRAPHVAALGAWDHLTALDLWRVRLVLTAAPGAPNDGDGAGDPPLEGRMSPQPRFRLRLLVLTQCELGGADELRWLLGSTATGDAERSSCLTDLQLSEVAFAHHARSSGPMLAVLGRDRVTNDEPAFTRSLSSLSLLLEHPIVGDSDAESSTTTTDGLLAPFHAVKEVVLGGPGVDYPLLASLFPSPSPANAPTSSTTPSELVSLTLQCLTHPSIPLAALVALLRPSRMPPRLRTLTLHEAWHYPRQMPWHVLRTTTEPRWTAFEDDEAWDDVERALRSVARSRRRGGGGGVGAARDGVRLWRNRAEVRYLAGLGDHSSDEDEGDGDGSEGGRGDGSSEAGTDASASPDPNALFVPAASEDGDDENEADWLARRRREADEEAGHGVRWDSDE